MSRVCVRPGPLTIFVGSTHSLCTAGNPASSGEKAPL